MSYSYLFKYIIIGDTGKYTHSCSITQLIFSEELILDKINKIKPQSTWGQTISSLLKLAVLF